MTFGAIRRFTVLPWATALGPNPPGQDRIGIPLTELHLWPNIKRC